jgi:Predicted ATP-dependent protease
MPSRAWPPTAPAWTENQSRLSARIGDLFQLVSEADFIRQLASDEMTDAGHIERALKAKATRTGRVSQRVLDDMLAGIILIDTEGAAIGKCNGLTVLEVGDSAFGMPARISATVYPGGSGIVDIEREVNLGQPIHSKGVMILTGYLGSRYAQEFPWRFPRASPWSSPTAMSMATVPRWVRRAR